jgi:hypothetical protein
MTPPLYQDDWVTVTLDSDRGLVRYTRSAVPYADLGDLERSFAAVAGVLPKIVPGAKLLLDLRLAPPRNDAAFEKRTMTALGAFTARFGAVATLVRTAVGKLQSVRLARERGSAPHVFDDERAALDYLGVR